jgi:DNA transformation protein
MIDSSMSSRQPSRKQQFAHHVVDLMQAFAPVQARAMFGGFGIYHDGLMFALIVQEQLYFKADEQSWGDFIDLGLQPFTYQSKGKVTSLKYFQAPPEVFDEPDQMAMWARKAYDCALRCRRPKPSARARTQRAQ